MARKNKDDYLLKKSFNSFFAMFLTIALLGLAYDFFAYEGAVIFAGRFIFVIIILVFILLLTTVSVHAQTNDTNNFDLNYYYNHLDQAKEMLVQNIQNLPQSIQNKINSEKVRFDIKGDNNITYSAVVYKVKNGYKITKKNLNDYSVKIKTTEQQLKKIEQAKDKLKEISNQLSSKETQIQAKGLFNKIKIVILKLALKIKSWFS